MATDTEVAPVRTKGGCYTYNKNANKRYVDPSFCRDKS
jgi:hypothetical protein